MAFGIWGVITCIYVHSYEIGSTNIFTILREDLRKMFAQFFKLLYGILRYWFALQFYLPVCTYLSWQANEIRLRWHWQKSFLLWNPVSVTFYTGYFFHIKDFIFAFFLFCKSNYLSFRNIAMMLIA